MVCSDGEWLALDSETDDHGSGGDRSTGGSDGDGCTGDGEDGTEFTVADPCGCVYGSVAVMWLVVVAE